MKQLLLPQFVVLIFTFFGLGYTQVPGQDPNYSQIIETPNPVPTEVEEGRYPPNPGVIEPLSPPPSPLGAPKAVESGRKKSRGITEAPKGKNGKTDAGKAKSSMDSSTGFFLDYVDEPILDVLRAIATAYRLSIIPDKDIGDVKVTIHLEKMPVIEGLEKLCRSHGLEFIREGNVYRVRRLRDLEQSMVHLRAGKLFLDVKNKPVRDFLREFGEKTGINIVSGQGLKGSVTGQLRDVTPLDGLKALMAANNFTLRQRSGVYLVEMVDSSDVMPNFGGRRRMPNPTSGSGEVDVHDSMVTLNCRNSQLSDVLREIAEQANLNYSVISDLSGTVNAQLKDVSVDDAMVNILKGTRFTFIRTQGTLLIGDRNPNTPSGQALSGVELVYLKYIRAENLEKLLPKASQDNLKVVKEQNALLISGTGEDIAQAKEFIEKVDLPTPQVMLEVVVVEYNRQKNSTFGVDQGKSSDLGPNLNMTGSFSGIHNEFSQGSFKGAIGLLPPKFELNLKALESQKRGKVLAMPKITTLNGNKATLNVTRTNYYKVESYNGRDGLQNSDYRAIDDGITIDITPWITLHGAVNINVTPSIKTSGQAIGNSPAPITNRSITTNVELRDGETLALGGLITSQEDNQREFVPILGAIPLLKWLFSYRKQLKTTTELVIYVTPHVLLPASRMVNLEEEFRAMDKRDGSVKSEDIILIKSKKATDKPLAPVKK